MFQEIYPRQNSTSNSTNIVNDYFFGACEDMMMGTYVWISFNTISILFGLPACVAVLSEQFLRHRRGTPATPNDVFMLNLTAMDLVFLAFLPLAMLNYLKWYDVPLEQVAYFIYSLSMNGRPLFMVCICLDCYLAVVHPITYRARKSLTPRILMAVGVWVVTVAHGAVYIKHVDFFFNPGVMVVYAVSVLTIGLCDLFILRTLWRSGPGGGDLHPQKKKAFQVIINSLVMTVVAYLPLLVTCCFRSLASMHDVVFHCYVGLPILITSTAGTAIMPILYLGNLSKLDFIKFCRSV